MGISQKFLEQYLQPYIFNPSGKMMFWCSSKIGKREREGNFNAYNEVQYHNFSFICGCNGSVV